MVIYGTALLATCVLIGMLVGRSIGALLGVEADIGGVGIAMILLIVSCHWLQRRGLMNAPTESGVAFWGSIYVPIVVAMAASQNVYGALTGGVMATIAGATGVVICFVLVGLFVRLSGASAKDSNSAADQFE
jgi:malonate transporter MadL subunit